MPKKLLITLLVILGIGGVAVAVFVYRNITSQPAAVVEQSADLDVDEIRRDTATQVEKTGQFKDADSIHKGSGTASIVNTAQGPVLKFENFSVTSGPDLFVYLSPNPGAGELGDFASLGELKSTSGDQVYNLPADYEQYQSVVIWCRAFNTKFATADLR